MNMTEIRNTKINREEKLKPPVEIPDNLLDEYTLNGRIRVKYSFFDDSFSRQTVYESEEVDKYVEAVKQRKTFCYGKTDLWLYKALKKYDITGLDVAIMGSAKPRYEAVCLAFGGNPMTIEYNKIFSKDTRLKVLTTDEYERNPVKFDAAFSISSFEHYGLGRYGDPLMPNGDLEIMEKMKNILKPGGLLFLAVPIGQDTLVWNAHRVYGSIRLPKLLEGWELLDVFGVESLRLNRDWGSEHGLQPVFVLKNSGLKGKDLMLIYHKGFVRRVVIKVKELFKRVI